MLSSSSLPPVLPPALIQDWKSPRTAKGSTSHEGLMNPSSTVLRCVTNSKIPCTKKEFLQMGTKVKISVTVLGVSKIGWAFAPFKKATGNKKSVKDPNAKPLFEMVRAGDKFTGVTMFSFKKANSNFDRGDHDSSISATLHIGQVCEVVGGIERSL
jgi:hypothetical protein